MDTRAAARRTPSSQPSPQRGEGAGNIVSLEGAFACYAETIEPLNTESVATADALHRVLGEPARAAVDLPAFSQTAVDGYAVRAIDTEAAADTHPVRLELSGDIPAGVQGEPALLEPGKTMRILTGAPLPGACDAVARQELVERDGERITLFAPIARGKDIRFQAEELKQGTPLGHTGRRITPGLAAALAMAGVAHVDARRRPRISVLVTGNELAPAGRPLRSGEVHDANGPLIRAWLLENGYPEPTLRHVRDEETEVEAALGDAFDTADVVITSGGVSVGDRDYIPVVAERLGAEPLFWKVAQKPGKPLYFARRRGRFLLGLPGNPAAVLIGLVFHARRVLDCFEGCAQPGPPLYAGRLAEPLAADCSRARLVRARREVNADGVVELHPLAKQGSHMLSNLESADSLVWVPVSDERLERGTLVKWTPL